MKILAIRGEGLASLSKRFEILLEAPPLGDVGVFAIVGPTGAGKSTLLDALCLALYDRTPRLLGRGVRIETGSDDGETMASGDPRNMLRKGANRGWAEVDFRGIDGKTWRARWEVRRARGGRLKDAVITLLDCETGMLEGGHRKSEVLAEIEARLGLTFPQFQRAVLLAQGRFAAFLEADDKERAELLERMTGTEIYGHISMEVARRAKEERRALERLDERLASLVVLSEAERRACEDEIPVRRLEAARAGERISALEAQMRWYAELEVNTREQAEAERVLDELERQLSLAEPKRQEVEEAASIEPVRAPLERYDAAREARCMRQAEHAQALVELTRKLEALSDAQENHDSVSARGADVTRSFAALEPILREARALEREIAVVAERSKTREREAHDTSIALMQIEGEHTKWTTQLAALEQRLVDAQGRRAPFVAFDVIGKDDIARVSERLGHLVTVNEARSAARHRSVASRARLEEASHRAAVARERIDAQQELFAHGEGEVQARRRVLADMPPADVLRGALERLNQAREIFSLGMQATLAVRSAEQVISEASALMERSRIAVEAAELRARESRAHGERTRVALLEAERARDLARATLDLLDLRRNLVEGEPCPLCGAREHPFAHEIPARLVDELDARVRELRATMTEIDAEVARADAEALAERRASEDASNTRTRALEDRARHAEHSSSSWGRAKEQFSQLSSLPAMEFSELHDIGRTESFERTIAQIDEAKSRMLAMAKERDAAERALEDAIEVRDEARTKLFDMREAERHESTSLDVLRTRLDSDVQELERYDAEQRVACERLEPFRGALESCVGALESLDGARLEVILHALQAYEHARRDEEEANARIVSCRLERDRVIEELGAVQEDVKRAQEAGGKVRAELETLNARRAALLSGEVDEVESEALRELEEAKNARAEAARVLSSTETEVAAQRKVLSDANRLLELASERETQALARLTEALEHACADEGRARRVLARTWAEIEAYRQELARLDEQRANQRAIAMERARRRVEHEAHPPEGLFEREALAREQIQAKAALSVEHSRLARIEERLLGDERIRAERALTETEIDSQREHVRTWGALESLIGSSDGKRFRVFAQGLTLELLLDHANVQLESLAPRYELRRVPGKELAIIVIDRYMGDEVRGIKSLSGGETFLVSLALALALGSITARRVPVYSLFIDEGFGGLDGESLEIALAALESLHESGRHVGVVSHVAALSERFAARVEVHPRGHAESEVRVVSAGGFAMGA